MATFDSKWKPQNGWTVERTPNVAVVKLGDGYEQRQQKGIHSLLDKYSLTFVGVENLCNGRPNIAREAEAFLKAQGAVQSFRWIAPDSTGPRSFVCRSWTLTKSRVVWTLTATFEEVTR